MWYYDTNWMGPLNTKWIELNGTNWNSGRIDCRYYGSDPEIIDEYPWGFELGVPIMNSESWQTFSDWLSKYRTEELVTEEFLLQEFKKQTGFTITELKREDEKWQ